MLALKQMQGYLCNLLKATCLLEGTVAQHLISYHGIVTVQTLRKFVEFYSVNEQQDIVLA